MGAGLALQAKTRYPGIQDEYRKALKTMPDKSLPWWQVNYPHINLAPTKQHWKNKSTLQEVTEVLIHLSKLEGGPFAIPEMGCGLGGLFWPQVKPAYEVLRPTLVEWVIIHPPNSGSHQSSFV